MYSSLSSFLSLYMTRILLFGVTPTIQFNDNHGLDANVHIQIDSPLSNQLIVDEGRGIPVQAHVVQDSKEESELSSFPMVIQIGQWTLWTQQKTITYIPGLGVGQHVISFQMIHSNGSRMGEEKQVAFEIISRCAYDNRPLLRQARFYAGLNINQRHQVPIRLYSDETLAQGVHRILAKLPSSDVSFQSLFKALNEQTLAQVIHQERFQKLLLSVQGPLQIIIGAANIGYPKWIPSDINVLDVTNVEQLRRYFAHRKVDAFLAEHVWEHMTLEDGLLAAQNCYEVLRPGGYLRLAVPDTQRPRLSKTELMKSEIRDEHQVMYTIASFSSVFENAGFNIRAYEYHERNGTSRVYPWNPEEGRINRSSLFDPRGAVSIIIDAIKPLRGNVVVSQPLAFAQDERAFPGACDWIREKQWLEQVVQDPTDLSPFDQLVRLKHQSRHHFPTAPILTIETKSSVLSQGSLFCPVIIKVNPIVYRSIFQLCIDVAFPGGNLHQCLQACAQRSKCVFQIQLPSPIKLTAEIQLHARAYDHEHSMLGEPSSTSFIFIKEMSLWSQRITNRTATSSHKSFRSFFLRSLFQLHEPDVVFRLISVLSQCSTLGRVSNLGSWEECLLTRIHHDVDQFHHRIIFPLATHMSMIRLEHLVVPMAFVQFSQSVQMHPPPFLPSTTTRIEKNSSSSSSRSSLATVLPFCFFTIVLNGMPFLPYHVKEMLRLQHLSLPTFRDWEWHVVEGVAAGRAQYWNAYHSSPLPSQFYTPQGRSTDGSEEYLDELAARFPHHIHVHRKMAESGQIFWRDKLEMVNYALQQIRASQCILIQLDVDELWTAEQWLKFPALLQTKPCAYFHCHYFITPTLVTTTAQGYSHKDHIEWLRAWKFERGMIFLTHAPPVLIQWYHHDERTLFQYRMLRGHDHCSSQNETSSLGLVFTHYAYTFPHQVALKEHFYGYAGALAQWTKLSKLSFEGPMDVGLFLDWVPLGTFADIPERRVIAPEVDIIPLPTNHIPTVHGLKHNATQVVVLFDAVMWQMESHKRGGIWRVYNALVSEVFSQRTTNNIRWIVLLRQTLAQDHLNPLLERLANLTLANIDHVQFHAIPAYDVSHPTADQDMLRELGQLYQASTFISSSYTRASRGSHRMRHILLVHDLIPEVFHWPETGEWKVRTEALVSAEAVLTVSRATARAFREWYPDPSVTLRASSNGIDRQDIFYVRHGWEIQSLREQLDVPPAADYLLVIGPRGGYKNIHPLLYRALRHLSPHGSPSVVLVLIGPEVSLDEQRLLQTVPWRHHAYLSDDGLARAMTGALALVYLSRREGFGLPIGEALACGCPVVILDKAELPILEEIQEEGRGSKHPFESCVFKVKQEDPERHLADVIRYLAQHRPRCRGVALPTWKQLAMDFLELIVGPASEV